MIARKDVNKRRFEKKLNVYARNEALGYLYGKLEIMGSERLSIMGQDATPVHHENGTSVHLIHKV